MRRARALSIAALALGIALAWFFLFRPSGTMCTIATAPPGATADTQTCRSMSMVEVAGGLGKLFPAPLLWFALWALAPALAVIGTFARDRHIASGLVVAAIVGDLTGIVSIGGGFLFTFALVPLLLFALLATRRASALG
jgi:hypothetical protein